MPLKNPLLHRYWFAFEPPPLDDLPRGTIRLAPWPPGGCGVTAYTREDAEYLMQTRLGTIGPLLPIRHVIDDVAMSTIAVLRHGLIIPIWRGIWYPLYPLFDQETSVTGIG